MAGEKINRVERALRFEAQDEAILAAGGKDLRNDIGFQRRKLLRLDTIAARYQGTTNRHEKESLYSLKKERRAIEKASYSWPEQILRRIQRPFSQKANLKKDVDNYDQDIQQISRDLVKYGFGGYEIDLRKLVRPEQALTEIPLSKYLGTGERIDYTIQIEKDLNGRLHFEGFKATLISKEEGINRTHNFRHDNDQMYHADLALNLLYGRSFQSDTINVDGSIGKKWTNFDLIDKTAGDDFRIRQIPGEDFNIDLLIRGLPVENMEAARLAEVIKGVKNGRQEQITFTKDGKDEVFYIEADPMKKTVNIFDAHHNRTTLISAVGEKQSLEVGKANVLTQEGEHIMHASNKKEVNAENKNTRIIELRKKEKGVRPSKRAKIS